MPVADIMPELVGNIWTRCIRPLGNPIYTFTAGLLFVPSKAHVFVPGNAIL